MATVGNCAGGSANDAPFVKQYAQCSPCMPLPDTGAVLPVCVASAFVTAFVLVVQMLDQLASLLLTASADETAGMNNASKIAKQASKAVYRCVLEVGLIAAF